VHHWAAAQLGKASLKHLKHTYESCLTQQPRSCYKQASTQLTTQMPAKHLSLGGSSDRDTPLRCSGTTIAKVPSQQRESCTAQPTCHNVDFPLPEGPTMITPIRCSHAKCNCSMRSTCADSRIGWQPSGEGIQHHVKYNIPSEVGSNKSVAAQHQQSSCRSASFVISINHSCLGVTCMAKCCCSSRYRQPR